MTTKNYTIPTIFAPAFSQKTVENLARLEEKYHGQTGELTADTRWALDSIDATLNQTGSPEDFVGLGDINTLKRGYLIGVSESILLPEWVHEIDVDAPTWILDIVFARIIDGRKPLFWTGETS